MKSILNVLMMLLVLVLVGCSGVDNDVLDNGKVINFHSTVINRNHGNAAMINGRFVSVSTWNVEYVDIHGKVGKCPYFTESNTGGISLNVHITCMDTNDLVGV